MAHRQITLLSSRGKASRAIYSNEYANYVRDKLGEPRSARTLLKRYVEQQAQSQRLKQIDHGLSRPQIELQTTSCSKTVSKTNKITFEPSVVPGATLSPGRPHQEPAKLQCLKRITWLSPRRVTLLTPTPDESHY